MDTLQTSAWSVFLPSINQVKRHWNSLRLHLILSRYNYLTLDVADLDVADRPAVLLRVKGSMPLSQPKRIFPVPIINLCLVREELSL